MTAKNANTTPKTYNGWANWQTWNVALWIGNDEGLYNAVRAARRVARRKFTSRTAREFVTDLLPNGTPDMGGKSEYRVVRWSEIARSMNEC